LVIDVPSKNNCSVVAAGIINPITGMRLTKTWMAEEIFPYAHDFYKKHEQKSGEKFWIDREIIRPANDVEQLNDALSRISDGFLGDYIEYKENDVKLDKTIRQKHGYFKIKKGGNLKVNPFLEYTRKQLQDTNSFSEEWINQNNIEYTDNEIIIGNHKTKNIIWCTGNYQAKEAPFDYLPFSPTIGEMLKIKTNELDPKYLYNKNAFILNQQEDVFVTGATFSRDLSKQLTEEGKQQMFEKINDITHVKYEVIDHYFGIRPTNMDRKPFIGLHLNLRNTYILNGLGAKGVTQAPYFAKEFVNFIQNKTTLDKEVNIERVHKKLKSN
jgi:glycine oxidase